MPHNSESMHQNTVGDVWRGWLELKRDVVKLSNGFVGKKPPSRTNVICSE